MREFYDREPPDRKRQVLFAMAQFLRLFGFGPQVTRVWCYECDEPFDRWAYFANEVIRCHVCKTVLAVPVSENRSLLSYEVDESKIVKSYFWPWEKGERGQVSEAGQLANGVIPKGTEYRKSA